MKIKLKHVQLNTLSNFLSNSNFMTKYIKIASFHGMGPKHKFFIFPWHVL